MYTLCNRRWGGCGSPSGVLGLALGVLVGLTAMASSSLSMASAVLLSTPPASPSSAGRAARTVPSRAGSALSAPPVAVPGWAQAGVIFGSRQGTGLTGYDLPFAPVTITGAASSAVVLLSHWLYRWPTDAEELRDPGLAPPPLCLESAGQLGLVPHREMLPGHP